MSESKLPTLQELNQAPDIAFKNDQFNLLVNQKPPEKWIKKAPAFMGGQSYIPIEKIEFLLKKLFQNYSIEVKSVQQLANSICVVVRIHYNHPVTGVKMFQDGIGAAPLKVDKGHSAAEMAHIKSSAVMTGAPAAESFAIKDAAEKLGAIFGSNINRKDVIDFKGSYMSTEELQEKQELERIEKFIAEAKTVAELESVPEKYHNLESFKTKQHEIQK